MKITKLSYKVLFGVAVLLIVIWTLVPFYWVLISAISPRVELYAKPPHWIPENPTLKPFYTVLVTGEGFRGGGGVSAAELIRKGLYNSLVIAIVTTTMVMVFSPMLGYAFSRLRFPGRNLWFMLFIGIIALPSWPVLIGLFSQFSYLRLLDTKIGLILLSFTFRIPFETWFMKGYFEAVPREVEDAALIDGCTHLGTLFRVSIPMVMPGLIAVSIISFLFTWNMFSAPLVLTYTLKSKPLTVAITEFIGQYFVHWDLMSAAAIIAIIPPVVVVLVFQKFIVKGLSAGAVKA
ncbi:binding-protein-dependent transport systems inner membrane component [Candidatus Vecturithrix granuli]|uniref:Binding-protein-dependent transport systems inner membrane component n=1 Tax=Vecturithrix granuli TaxID=1499967 RepID=A0A081BW47_VECG1|nr:binding-protein-dependent transport systems inner membrane component [Candidatus Vecturithrix granuli]